VLFNPIGANLVGVRFHTSQIDSLSVDPAWRLRRVALCRARRGSVQQRVPPEDPGPALRLDRARWSGQRHCSWPSRSRAVNTASGSISR